MNMYVLQSVYLVSSLVRAEKTHMTWILTAAVVVLTCTAGKHKATGTSRLIRKSNTQ